MYSKKKEIAGFFDSTFENLCQSLFLSFKTNLDFNLYVLLKLLKYNKRYFKNSFRVLINSNLFSI